MGTKIDPTDVEFFLKENESYFFMFAQVLVFPSMASSELLPPDVKLTRSGYISATKFLSKMIFQLKYIFIDH